MPRSPESRPGSWGDAPLQSLPWKWTQPSRSGWMGAGFRTFTPSGPGKVSPVAPAQLVFPNIEASIPNHEEGSLSVLRSAPMRRLTLRRWFRNSLLTLALLSLAVYLSRDFVFFTFLYKGSRADWELSEVPNECYAARD